LAALQSDGMYMNVFVRYGRREMGFGEKNYILDLVENGYIDVKWLDESPAKTPTPDANVTAGGTGYLPPIPSPQTDLIKLSKAHAAEVHNP